MDGWLIYIVVRYIYIVIRYIVKDAWIPYKRAARPSDGKKKAATPRTPRGWRVSAARVVPLRAARLPALQRGGGREGRPDRAALPGAAGDLRNRWQPRHDQRPRPAAP